MFQDGSVIALTEFLVITYKVKDLLGFQFCLLSNPTPETLPSLEFLVITYEVKDLLGFQLFSIQPDF